MFLCSLHLQHAPIDRITFAFCLCFRSKFILLFGFLFSRSDDGPLPDSKTKSCLCDELGKLLRNVLRGGWYNCEDVECAGDAEDLGMKAVIVPGSHTFPEDTGCKGTAVAGSGKLAAGLNSGCLPQEARWRSGECELGQAISNMSRPRQRPREYVVESVDGGAN